MSNWCSDVEREDISERTEIREKEEMRGKENEWAVYECMQPEGVNPVSIITAGLSSLRDWCMADMSYGAK